MRRYCLVLLIELVVFIQIMYNVYSTVDVRNFKLKHLLFFLVRQERMDKYKCEEKQIQFRKYFEQKLLF